MRLARFTHKELPDENGIITAVNGKYKYDDLIDVLKRQIEVNHFTIPLYGNTYDPYTKNKNLHIIAEVENIIFHDTTFDIECRMYQYSDNEIIDLIESKFGFGIISSYSMIDKDTKFIKIKSLYGFRLIQIDFDTKWYI